MLELAFSSGISTACLLPDSFASTQCHGLHIAPWVPNADPVPWRIAPGIAASMQVRSQALHSDCRCKLRCLRELEQMLVVREEQHLRLGAQLTEHLKGCHSTIVVELHQEIINNDWERTPPLNVLFDRGKPQR